MDALKAAHAGLQWGRNFFVTEIIEKDIGDINEKFELQWGRNFFVTEISPSVPITSTISSASMGP